jgi:murein DD-endopeptidase MepM/ murein hydrolase activator NlpD
MNLIFPVFFLFLSLSTFAADLPFAINFGSLTQGAVVSIELPSDVKQAWLDDTPLMITKTHQSVFGLGRDVKTINFRWQNAAGKSHQQTLVVTERVYDIQHINGLPNNKVNPNPAELAEIRQNNADLAQQRVKRDNSQLPKFPFAWPVAGRISGVYGSQRVLNGQPRRPHFGVDIAAPEGTPIYAPADATVLLVNPKMVLTGKTMLLDHGLGLKSVYIHMSQIDVHVGDTVRQGQLIGRVGKTGRATGPHLHWGLTWFSVPINAATAVATATPPALTH